MGADIQMEEDLQLYATSMKAVFLYMKATDKSAFQSRIESMACYINSDTL